jgi:hypothetical protein
VCVCVCLCGCAALLVPSLTEPLGPPSRCDVQKSNEKHNNAREGQGGIQ